MVVRSGRRCRASEVRLPDVVSRAEAPECRHTRDESGLSILSLSRVLPWFSPCSPSVADASGRGFLILHHCQFWDPTAGAQCCLGIGNADISVAVPQCGNCEPTSPRFNPSKSSTYTTGATSPPPSNAPRVPSPGSNPLTKSISNQTFSECATEFLHGFW
jgi:hypothetical protein